MYSKIVLIIIILLQLNNYGLLAQNILFDKYKGVTPSKATIRIASASVIVDKWQKEINWQRIEKMVNKLLLMVEQM